MTIGTRGRRHRGDGWYHAVGALVAAALVLVGALQLGGSRVTQAPAVRVTPSAPSSAHGPVSMIVSPGSWVMDGGASVTISAQLGSAPDGCSYPATTIDWALDSSSLFLGTLSASTGNQVLFRPFDSTQGTVDVIASSSFVLTCGESASPTLATGFASIHVAAALAVSYFSTYSDVIRPGTPASFNWAIHGGMAPFELQLDFGDGFQTQFNLSEGGPGTTSHRYSAGTYSPVLVVTDQTGRSVRTTLATSVLVSASLGVAISASPAITDTGVTVNLSAEISGGTPPYTTTWTLGGQLSPSMNTTYTPVSGPNFTAKLLVSDLSGSQVEARRTIVVNSIPNLRFGGAPVHGDVGFPLSIALNVTGGTAPFELGWVLDPSKSQGNVSLSRQGPATALLLPSDTGPVWATFRLVDSVGATSILSGWVANASESPTTFLASSSGLTEVGLSLTASLSVFAGTPPFSGSLTASLPVRERSGPQLQLTGLGPWNQTLTFESPGNATILSSVRDSVGAVSFANATVLVLPPLSARIEMLGESVSAGSILSFSAIVSGGEPPYSASYNGSDGEAGTWNLSQPGPVFFGLTPAAPGFLSVMVDITDGLGAVDRVVETAWVQASSSPPPPASTAGTQPSGTGVATSWVGAAVAFGLIAVPLAWFLRRRAHRPVPGGAGGVLKTIRTLVRENDGADEATIVLLAEEQGVEPESARRAVQRWRQAGRILEEDGPDGELLLTWAPGASARGQRPPDSDEGEGLG